MLDRLRGFFHDLSGHEPALLYFLEQFYYVVSVMFSPGESCYTGVLDKRNIPGYSAEFLLNNKLKIDADEGKVLYEQGQELYSVVTQPHTAILNINFTSASL